MNIWPTSTFRASCFWTAEGIRALRRRSLFRHLKTPCLEASRTATAPFSVTPPPRRRRHGAGLYPLHLSDVTALLCVFPKVSPQTSAVHHIPLTQEQCCSINLRIILRRHTASSQAPSVSPTRVGARAGHPGRCEASHDDSSPHCACLAATRQVDMLVHSRSRDGGVGSDLRTRTPASRRRVIPSPRRLPLRALVTPPCAQPCGSVTRQFTVLAGWRWRVDVPAYSGLCDDLCRYMQYINMCIYCILQSYIALKNTCEGWEHRACMCTDAGNIIPPQEL